MLLVPKMGSRMLAYGNTVFYGSNAYYIMKGRNHSGSLLYGFHLSICSLYL